MASRDQYLPATFEQRGCTIPFTTPSLNQARIRLEEGERLVLVLPNFGESDSTYVLPWAAVPEFLSMTVHDKALHDEIASRKLTSPTAIRLAAYRLAQTGLAGPLMAEAAKEALKSEDEDLVMTHFLIVVGVFQVLDLSTRELVEMGHEGGKWKAAARTMLDGKAEVLGLTGQQLLDSIGQLALVLSPSGLPTAPSDGRLRRILREIGVFKDETGTLAKTAGGDLADQASFAAETAALTSGLGTKVLAEIDTLAGDLRTLLSDGGAAFQKLRRATARLSWLVDGWDLIVHQWQAARELDGEDREVAIALVFGSLPMVPRKEVEWHADAQGNRAVTERHRKQIRAYQDWRTGEYDLELLMRNEALRARLMAARKRKVDEQAANGGAAEASEAASAA